MRTRASHRGSLNVTRVGARWSTSDWHCSSGRWIIRNDTPHAAPHWKKRDGTVCRCENLHFATLESGVEHNVGNHEGAFVRGTLEAHTQKMPGCAVRSVVAKQPRGRRELELAVAVPDLAHNTVIARFETNRLFVMLYPQTQPSAPLSCCTMSST
jgi:hypothetical protein